MKKRRPFLIWVLLLLFLFFGWEGFVRIWQTAAQQSILTALDLRVSPVYLAASGAVWLTAGMLPALALWFRRRWAVAAGWVGVLVVAATYWVDRLFLSASPLSRGNSLFAAGLTAFLMFLTLGALSLETTREYLGKD